jgi:antitoxin component of MazEF toxin-antitoxin module
MQFLSHVIFVLTKSEGMGYKEKCARCLVLNTSRAVKYLTTNERRQGVTGEQESDMEETDMLYEGSAQLRTDNQSLQVRLEGDAARLLSRFHFSEGQEVRVRISDERLEIRPQRETDDIQAGLGGMAAHLQEIGHTLRTLRSHLPKESLETEASAPPSLEDHLSGSIECVVTDHVEPAVEQLEEAARITPEEIQRRWAAQAGAEERLRKLVE